MKKTILISILAVCASSAFAQDTLVTGTKVWEGLIGTKVNTGLGLNDSGPIYSNITNFTGFAFSNGSATNQTGNTITKLVADDLLTGLPNTTVDGITFSVSNLDAVAVSARARVRFYSDAAGLPGTALAGFTFNPITFTAGSVALFSFNPGAALVVPADGKVWAGITFDDNTGATGATVANLNNLGQGIFNPPTGGVSQDLAFLSTNPGSNFSNNPAGGLFNFGANGPVANFGWQFTSAAVPEPASFAVLGLGLLGLVSRRRRSSK